MVPTRAWIPPMSPPWCLVSWYPIILLTMGSYANSGEPGILPTLNHTRIHQTLQLALREARVHQIQTRKLVYLHRSQFQCTLNPFVLLDTVRIFICSHGMRHTLNTVQNGTHKIISWVCMKLSPSTVVRCSLTPVEHGIPHTLVLVQHVHLSPHAVICCLTLTQLLTKHYHTII